MGANEHGGLLRNIFIVGLVAVVGSIIIFVSLNLNDKTKQTNSTTTDRTTKALSQAQNLNNHSK